MSETSTYVMNTIYPILSLIPYLSHTIPLYHISPNIPPILYPYTIYLPYYPLYHCYTLISYLSHTIPDTLIAPRGHEIYEQDLVTLRITLTRMNLPETSVNGKKAKRVVANPVYAPYFPNTTYENWWFVLTDKTAEEKGASGEEEANIYAFEKVGEQGRTITHEVRFMAPPRTGTYQMELQVRVYECMSV